jgi:hypothetical protein
MEITLTFQCKVGGVLTNVTSAKLSDPTGTYGVKRDDTDAVVVVDDTAMTNSSTGVYQYSFTAPASGLDYTYYVEWVYDGETYHNQFTQITSVSEIEKTDILAFVNNALQESLSGTDLDVEIQTVLNDLSNMNLLIASDETQSLASSDTVLDYPSLYKDLVEITLTDASSNVYAPLVELPGGHEEYRVLKGKSNSLGRPEFFSEFNEKFWLWYPSNGVYTALIEYYKYHAQDVNNIEFGPEFINCINFGTTFYRAAFKGRDKYVNIYGPLYGAEKELRRLNMPFQPAITRSA